MSGSGRKSCYRKAVVEDVLYGEPTLEKTDHVVKVVGLRGSNLFEVAFPDESKAVSMLPQKFRKLIWVKRGDFVIVSGTDEDITTADGNKGAVKYMIKNILYKEQIKTLKNEGNWPAEFDTEPAQRLTNRAQMAMQNLSLNEESSDDSDEDSETDANEIFVNRNRHGGGYVEESSDEDDSDDE